MNKTKAPGYTESVSNNSCITWFFISVKLYMIDSIPALCIFFNFHACDVVDFGDAYVWFLWSGAQGWKKDSKTFLINIEFVKIVMEHTQGSKYAGAGGSFAHCWTRKWPGPCGFLHHRGQLLCLKLPQVSYFEPWTHTHEPWTVTRCIKTSLILDIHGSQQYSFKTKSRL